MNENIKSMCDHLREQAKDYALMEQAKEYALEYMRRVQDRSVFPNDETISNLEVFRESLNDEPSDPYDVIRILHEFGSPATVAQTGGRYFGFVCGGIAPAALAAKWISDTWDQNAGMYVMSPVAGVIEDVCEKWLVELLGLPGGTAAGFVGGSCTATLCALAAGRNSLLDQLGYDVSKKGLFGAPEIKVVLGEGAHSTIYKALSILGLGSERIITVPTDEQGRIRAYAVPELDTRTLLILQAGNVNSGAYDDFAALCKKAREAGAWIHIDGAFGLWAAASKRLGHLVKGAELADSWSIDAHKTLNAPYDNGIVFCRNRDALVQSLHMSGAYIVYSENRDGMIYTLDMSRRGRIFELWATLKSLGKKGVSELVDDLHDKAVYFAKALEQNGFEIKNEICFNQVLISLGDSGLTEKVLRLVQNSGECWCGDSKWDGQSVIRISVCSYRTTYEDIDRSVAAFAAAKEKALSK